jgi:hypothetical protein
MLDLLIFIGAGIGGFIIARDYVYRRFRFVDAIHSPAAPWIAGFGVALITWPIAALLPFVTTATSAILGLGTGLGARSAAKRLKAGA